MPYGSLHREGRRLSPYGKPLTERNGPYGKGRSLRESPLRGWLPLQKRTAYGKLWGEILPKLGGNFRLCAVDQKRPFFLRAGPLLAFLPFKEAYGKAGPLREAPYGEGRSLREGPVLTGGSLTRTVPFTKKDDEQAYGLSPYGKTLTGRDGPYGKGRSLRKGPGCLTGPFTKKDQRLGPYGKPLTERVRSLREGPVLTGGWMAFHKKGRRGLREGLGPYGKRRDGPYEKGSLRRGPGCLTGPFTEKDDEEAYGKAGPLREAPD